MNTHLSRKRNIFTLLGKDHVPRRRRITNAYSNTFIQDSPQVREILSTLTRFLAKIGLVPIPKSVEQAHCKMEDWALRLAAEREDAGNEANLKPHSERDIPIVYNQLRLARYTI